MNTRVEDKLVVTLEYTLFVEDEIMEQTARGEGIQFIQGQEQIIPGLEKALYGLEIGEEKRVVIPPQEAYGEYDPESLQVAQKDEFSEEIPLDVGTFLDLEDNEGEVLSAQIIDADAETITLDFNHPLAGETLIFEVKVTALRLATPEELQAGEVL
jgi:FKBP-type peptidyl-prolyl cis-trans isomerase SlyD